MRLLPRRNKQWQPELADIHEYTQDLQRITVLRDKCTDKDEKGRYDRAIEVMQEVLIFLNSNPNI